jgi:multiple antibiotic resistance protein
MIMGMVSLNLADMTVTFLALLGPQKVLLAFARAARTLDTRSLRLVAAATAITAACVGAACALTAPWLATFFHISTPALELAAGAAFFVYALALVFGIHVDLADPAHVPMSGDGDLGAAAEADPDHPVSSGIRTLLLPWVVSPLAVAAVLEESLLAGNWGARWEVAGAFALVAVINAVSGIALGPLLGRTHDNVLEVFSRLLGILLAAVGVQLFLIGLTTLGVIHPGH